MPDPSENVDDMQRQHNEQGYFMEIAMNRRVKVGSYRILKWVLDKFNKGESLRWVPCIDQRVKRIDGEGKVRRVWIGKSPIRDHETEVWAAGFEALEFEDGMCISTKENKRLPGCD